MKKMMFVIFWIQIGLLFCSGYGQASEYFPLRDGAQWDYVDRMRVSGEEYTGKSRGNALAKQELDGREVVPLRATMMGGDQLSKAVSMLIFYLETDEGVKVFAKQASNDIQPKVKENEEWEFRYPLSAGASWIIRQNVIEEGVLVPVLNTIERMDDVLTVEAGSFEKCMKINRYFSGEVSLGSDSETAEVSVSGERWYAPGVGVIKRCDRVKSGKLQLDYENCSELKSFNNQGVAASSPQP
ncbi:MAG: hypothetical protein AB2L11_00505 [Syntrophobacteraceae bacterium]